MSVRSSWFIVSFESSVSLSTFYCLVYLLIILSATESKVLVPAITIVDLSFSIMWLYFESGINNLESVGVTEL